MLAAVQALIYNEEWWNITWGTRTLLPAVPLMILAALPVFDRLLNRGKKGARIVLFSVLGTGLLVQAGRLICSDPAYVAWTVNRTGESVNSALQWRWDMAPLFRYWQLGFAERLTDISWLNLYALTIPLIVLLLCAVSALTVSFFHLFNKLKITVAFLVYS